MDRINELIHQRISQAYITKWIQNSNPADVAGGPTGYMTPPYIQDSVLNLNGQYTAIDLAEAAAKLAAVLEKSGGSVG